MAKNRILIMGDPIQKEAAAGGTITPGHLVQYSAADTVTVHGTAGGNARKAFAREWDIQGKGIDNDYSSGERVMYYVCRPGDEVYALVAAGASAISVGDALESAGDGTLRKKAATTIDATATTTYTEYEDSVVGYAKEAVNNSGGSSEARIKVEVA
jgi:hypothetical protein